MTSQFRPCIDLHEAKVKQIVGGTLETSSLKTNFVSSHPPEYYAQLYRKHNLIGGHVIKLGHGNDSAAQACLAAWPKGLQIGGGITIDNAQEWLDYGADKVIITSWLFPNAQLDMERLRRISERISSRQLVIDLSCRKRSNEWIVAMNKWQTLTNTKLNQETFDSLCEFCSEFLIHAADVEGLCKGVDGELVERLGKWTGKQKCTYAGGGKSIDDLEFVDRISGGRVDLTLGSAMDIFGGSLKFSDCLNWNQNQIGKRK